MMPHRLIAKGAWVCVFAVLPFSAPALVTCSDCSAPVGRGAGQSAGLRAEQALAPSDLLEITGRVQRVEVEGGGYVIAGEDGRTYQPMNLAADFRKPGLRVRLKARLRKDVQTILQAGAIIEVIAIEKL